MDNDQGLGGNESQWPVTGPTGPPSPGPAGPSGPGPFSPYDAGGYARPPGSDPPPEPIGLGPNTRCYEHPDRLAGALCRSCNRPICADCMVQAPVGWHCRRCVHQAARKSPVVRYRPGAVGMPSARQAPVTMALIFINLVLFLAATASPRLTFDSYDIPIIMSHFGQSYRLFASFFITNSFLDVALNMWCLYIIGRLVEPALGKGRFLALYLLAGLGGSVAYYLLGNAQVPAAGASGAIFGLFGAYFIVARRAAANTSSIIALIAINLVFSFTVPQIAWQAHVGGLLTGLVVASGLGLARRGRPRQERVADAAVLIATCVGLGLLLLLPPGVVNLG